MPDRGGLFDARGTNRSDLIPPSSATLSTRPAQVMEATARHLAMLIEEAQVQPAGKMEK